MWSKEISGFRGEEFTLGKFTLNKENKLYDVGFYRLQTDYVVTNIMSIVM